MITATNTPIDVPSTALASCDAGIAELRAGCASLPVADPKLLRRVAKMGNKSESFSREALELARQNPHLCPAGLDLQEAAALMALRDVLRTRYIQARQLADQLEMAMKVCGVEVFDSARTAYKSMKTNCRDVALLELLDHVGRSFRTTRAKAAAAPSTAVPVKAPVAPVPPTTKSVAVNRPEVEASSPKRTASVAKPVRVIRTIPKPGILWRASQLEQVAAGSTPAGKLTRTKWRRGTTRQSTRQL